MTDERAHEPQTPDESGDETREASDEDLSLEQLNSAFAQMLGAESADAAEHDGGDEDERSPAGDQGLEPTDEVSPRSILEAMLFVGDPNNQPLTAQTAAGLMRGVEPDEIDDLVRELNQHYSENRCPYAIASEGAGYRLVLRDEFEAVRQRFYGQVREARLSQAAIDVLALVAYNQPVTSEDVAKLRGSPSGAILSQLVRRQILVMERPEVNPRKPVYRTTERFLELFGLERLEDLPQSQEMGPR